MANFEALVRWNFSSSTNPEILRSDLPTNLYPIWSDTKDSTSSGNLSTLRTAQTTNL